MAVALTFEVCAGITFPLLQQHQTRMTIFSNSDGTDLDFDRTGANWLYGSHSRID
jgi:hypothetical protein